MTRPTYSTCTFVSGNADTLVMPGPAAPTQEALMNEYRAGFIDAQGLCAAIESASRVSTYEVQESLGSVTVMQRSTSGQGFEVVSGRSLDEVETRLLAALAAVRFAKAGEQTRVEFLP